MLAVEAEWLLINADAVECFSVAAPLPSSLALIDDNMAKTFLLKFFPALCSTVDRVRQFRSRDRISEVTLKDISSSSTTSDVELYLATSSLEGSDQNKTFNEKIVD